MASISPTEVSVIWWWGPSLSGSFRCGDWLYLRGTKHDNRLHKGEMADLWALNHKSDATHMCAILNELVRSSNISVARGNMGKPLPVPRICPASQSHVRTIFGNASKNSPMSSRTLRFPNWMQPGSNLVEVTWPPWRKSRLRPSPLVVTHHLRPWLWHSHDYDDFGDDLTTTKSINLICQKPLPSREFCERLCHQ